MASSQRHQIAQGDVLVTPVASLPKGAKNVPRDGSRVILAYGEVTGHAHALHEKHVTLYQTEDDRRFLDIRKAAATLVHEEHGSHVLAPGVYEVTTQREYAPDAIRSVRD